MSSFQIVANLLAYGVFSLGALLVWPSRRNVVAWLGVPFFVVAYLIPLLVIDYSEVAPSSTISSLTWMNLTGAVVMVLGLATGAHMKLPPLKLRWRRSAGGDGMPVTLRRTRGVLLAGCIVMTLCFVWMGFLPAFAESPFLAKFFKGPYKEKYDQVSVFYRLSQTLVATSLPLAMALFFELRDRKLLVPMLWAIGLFAVALNRGPVVAGAVLICGVWASRRSLRMLVFLSIATAIYCLGSSVYVLLGIIVSDQFDLWTEIARGAPDIQDHLTFLNAFDPGSQLTHGLSFVGGLVPGNFRYNPAVYTLAVVNDSFDVSDIASGGFRLPPSISGYMAFSWSGVVLVSWLTGVLTGCFTAHLRRMPRNNFAQQVASLLWFQIVAGFWIGFYALAYQSLIAVALFTYLVPNVGTLIAADPVRKPFWLRLRRPRSATRIAAPVPE